MGVVRYLCITILLVAAVAAACNNGAANNHGECVCQSGHAAVSGQADCDNAFGAVCNAGAAVASEKRDDRFPILDEEVSKISFRQNTLKLSIVSEIVPKRTYTDIKFVGATNAHCSLQSDASLASFWTQAAQTAAGKCRDEFALSMLWDNWQGCGFVSSSDDTYYIFRAQFVIYYTDNVGHPYVDPDTTYSPEMTRRSTVAYKVYVRFQKIVDLTVFTDVTVNNTVGLQAAVTKFEYDPSTMILTLGFSTVVLWPNMFDRSTVSAAISGSLDGHIDGTITPVNSASAEELNELCKVYENNCLQYFEFHVQLAGAYCDFNGLYVITGTAYTCRDTQTCTSASQSTTLTVTTSDVCGSVTAEPQIKGKLESFDAYGGNVMEEFQLGYRGFFGVAMESLNDFNLTWIDIWVVGDAEVAASGSNVNDISIPTIQWLLRDFEVQTANFHKHDGTIFTPFATSPVDLNIADIAQDPRNTQVVFTHGFDFLFDSRVFHLPVFGQVKRGFTLHARGKIVYAGNEQYAKKRSEEVVDFIWEAPTKAFDGTSRFALTKDSTTAAVAAQETSNTNHVNTALLASLAPVAGIALVVIAVAVVAAVVIRRKKSTSFATLN